MSFQSPEDRRIASPFDEVDDVVELRRIAAYFCNLANENGGRLVRAETAASTNRQALERKTRGFSLLARLSSDVSATEQPSFMARILAGHLNSMLHMNRSVVLFRESSIEPFRLLGAAGYGEADLRRHDSLEFFLPDVLLQDRQTISTLGSHADEELKAFALFEIPYFMAVPVISDDKVRAVIVTGRTRERRPFLPPLNASDIETVLAISGFFGAYLARHRLIVRDRERIVDIERLVTERTAEIERQRVLLDLSIQQLRETQQQLIMREKLASLGQLMAGIAHEIRNPLNFINNFSELSADLAIEIEEILNRIPMNHDPGLAHEVDELFSMMRSNLGIIAMHGKRADSIVQNMLLHSRGEARSPELSDLNAILAESLDFAHQSAIARDPELAVTITQDLDPSIERLMLVPQEISRVFLNLLSNSFYALSKRRQEADAAYVPELTIKSRRLDESAEIRFRDNGVGISAEIKSQIFMPLFSTKPTGEGAGLGLSLSYDIIVGGHGGGIEVESTVNEFTEFIIRLPL